MSRINPRVDFAFKKLFGSEENKDLLISLLNAILSEEPPIVEIILKNPYNLADYKAGKLSILDIKAQDNTGRWFNVEIQITEDLDFDKRALYYWAKLVTEQLGEGMIFKKLQKTFSINILNFRLVANGQFHNRYRILNTETSKDDQLHDVFELHYIELRKFKKDYHELTTALDRWVTFLTRAHELEKERLPPNLSNDTAIVKAVNAVERLFSEEDRLIYEVRLQAIATVESQIDSALTSGLSRGMERGLAEGLEKGLQKGLEKGLAEGLEKGLVEGLEKGLVEGLEKGLAEGLEKGRQDALREIALSLLDILDNASIAKRTGLSIEEIEAMRKRT